MAGIGDGFIQGFELTSRIREKKKDREADKARALLEADRHKENIAVQKQLLTQDVKNKEADRLARRELTQMEIGARTSMHSKGIEADAARQAASLKAQGDAAGMERIGRSIEGFNKFAAAQKPPMARVRRPVDPMDETAGEMSYEVPMDEAMRTPAPKPPAYASPYASDIADAEKQLAEQNSQLAEGDTRGGFLGMQSRSGLAGDQKKRLLNLKARELEDKAAKGLMTAEQADAEAQRLQSAYGL
jgi:hypothetical protein